MGYAGMVDVRFHCAEDVCGSRLGVKMGRWRSDILKMLELDYSGVSRIVVLEMGAILQDRDTNKFVMLYDVVILVLCQSATYLPVCLSVYPPVYHVL